MWKGVSVSKNRRLKRRCSDSALGRDRSSNELDRLLYYRFGGFWSSDLRHELHVTSLHAQAHLLLISANRSNTVDNCFDRKYLRER